MAVLTGYLWWVVPKCEFRPASTMALQFITLLCAVHAIVLLVARQNLLSDKQSIQSVGPITVVAIDEQESRTSKQIVYLRCQRALGFYSLHELLYLPNQEVATVGKKESTWYLYADKEYKLIDDSTMTTLCK